MTRPIVALVLLALFGAAKLGPEQRLAADLRSAGFGLARLDLSLRQQIGQASFIAALGGFRAVVADLLWIRAHSEWQDAEWGSMQLLFNAATQLQPRCALFWDMAGWHMAWNASVAAREDPKQPRETLRIRAEREYIKVGEEFYRRGLEFNPDSPLLLERAANLFRDKLKDHCTAADLFDRAARQPDAPAYARRFAAYEMAECPGREREAYQRLAALYRESEKQRLPTLVRLIRELESKLGVPDSEKVGIPSP